MTDRIEAALQELAPSDLRVVDRSADHLGHGGWREGGETHFDVLVVSVAFVGQGRITRHRIVNRLLAGLMAEGIHALSLRALTPEEAVAMDG